tara:strand:+ start:324 stop:1553 length:1230 start_codon:yes stop_codon:yes gene_type:complete
MNIRDLTEEASGMGTASIAVAPVGVGGMQKRNPDGTAVNALDQDNLLGGTKKKKKKKKLSEVSNQDIAKMQQDAKTIKAMADSGNMDLNKAFPMMQDMFSTAAKADMGNKLLMFFEKMAIAIKKGIDTNQYSPKDLPTMQKAYDSIMSQMPKLKQMAVDSKKMAVKYGGAGRQDVGMEASINTLAEGKKPWFKDGVPMCSKECCGTPVMECTCDDNCKHCNCSELKKMMKENNMSNTNKKGSSIKEGLADLAQVAERDHEVQMARADLYKIAKYSIKLHEMLKTVSEQEGLEGWVQSKITKAADYMGSVYHHLDYDMKFAEEVVSEKAVKEGDGIYHDCAKSFKHKTYGECTVIPGEHTLLEDGTVTHYDATFTSCGQQYIVRNVPVSKMTDVVYEGHMHAAKKKKGKK